MKPGLFLSVFIVIAIIVAASFGLQFMPTPPEQLYSLPDSVAMNALYVCPAASSIFDPVSKIIAPTSRLMTIVFFFLVMLIFAMYAWGLYKNLLNDKFEAKEYKSAWFLVKILFWGTVVFTLLLQTPNGLRTAHLRGFSGDFVLCEENTPGARPVRASTVTGRSIK